LIPLQALRLPESDTTFQLAFLKSLFERIRALSPQKYRFAFDAQRLYEDFHWKLEQRRVAHPQRGMRAALAKMEGYCARLALALHLIWEVEAGRVPTPYIPKERVQQAIRLTEFFLSQVTLIHSEGAAALGEGGLTPRLSAILGKLKQFGELSARKLQASISWLRKVTPDKLRQDLMELAKLGYGTIQGKGNRLKLVRNQTADTADRSADKTEGSSSETEMLDIREFQNKDQPPADTVDIVADVVDGGEVSQPGGAFSSSLTEKPYQHISSMPSNPELSSTLAADEVSADISTVDNTAPLPEPDDSGGSYQDDGGGKDESIPATVEELANQILLCQTWVQVAETVNRDGDKLKKAACAGMTSLQRSCLTTMLATHLCDNPSDLNQLVWVPARLLYRALERLTFTIRRIGGAANVLDARLEYVPDCKFVKVEHLGEPRERWTFQSREGHSLAVFGVDSIHAIACS